MMKLTSFWRPICAAGLVAAMCFSAQSALAQAPSSTWEQIKSTNKVRLCAPVSEPWYYKDTSNSEAPGAVKTANGTWRGVGPGLADAIAKSLGVELEIVEVTWGTAVAALLANQCDFMFILNSNPERAQSIEFVSTPVLYYRVALLVKPEYPDKSWEELNDPSVRIGLVLGSTTEAIVQRMAPKATISRYQNMGDSLTAVLAGRVDGAISGTPTIDLAIARMRTGRTLVPTPVVHVPASTGIRNETDRRWSIYLRTVIAYYYEEGITQQIYNDFMAFRGVDPTQAASITR